MVLADLKVDGKPTKVHADANRNGFFYVLDRTNGKLIAANQYVQGELGYGHRPEDGRPIRDRRHRQSAHGRRRSMVWPSPRRQELGADVV